MPKLKLPRPRLNVAAKFVLLAVVFTVGPMPVVGVIAFGLGRRGIHTHTDLHLQSVVALKEQQVLDWADVQRRVLERQIRPHGSSYLIDAVLAGRPGETAYDEAAATLTASAQMLATSGSAIEQVIIVGKDGYVRFPTDTRSESDSLPEEAYFQAGREGIYLGLERSGGGLPASALILSLPAPNSSGAVIGAYLSPESVLLLLASDPGMGSSGRLYLVQPGVGAITANGVAPLASVAGWVDSQAAGTDGAGRYVGLDGDDVIGRSAPVDSLPWHAVAEIPTRDAFGDVGQVRTLILVSLGADGRRRPLV